MNTGRRFLSLGAVAAALVVAGCGAATGAPSATARPSSVPAATGSTASATVLPAVASGTLTVVGSGTVPAVPDTMRVTLGVNVSGDTVAHALAASNALFTKVLAGLKSRGVAAADIQTASFWVGQSYVNGAPSGYAVTNQALVTFHDLGKAGDLIGAAATIAGNDFTVGGVMLSRDDVSALVGPARQKAMDASRAQAVSWAGLVGRTVGDVVSVSEGTVGTAQPMQGGQNGAGAGVPVEQGQGTYTVKVTVVYALR